MSQNHSLEQQVIEIVEPLSEDSLQIPHQTEPNFTPQNQHKIIEEEEHMSRTETQLKPIKQSIKNECKLGEKKRKKIILYKCKICKTTGKKSSVKMCCKCKFHFHIECLDPDKILDESKAFICQLCDKESTTTIAANHSDYKERKQKILNKEIQSNRPLYQNSQEKQRLSSSFLNVTKLNTVYQTNFKKGEWKRRLYQFYIKHPYCFQNNKIVFPIEDHLLHIYQSILPSHCKTATPRPIPKFPKDGVPQKFYNELMEIQAFFYHFWQDLKTQSFLCPLFNKQIKLHEMKRKNLYEKFTVEGVTQIYGWILETLLRMYLNDIMERNRIDNMKFISSNAFFNLLTIINEEDKGLSSQLIIKMAAQIIKNLAKAPSFKNSFYCDYEVQQHNYSQLQYPKHLSCESKIKVITKLIRGLCDTDCFKEIVTKKSEHISILTKQKGQTLHKLKSIQNENIPLKEKIRESETELKQLAFSDPKQYEILNKTLQKLIVTHKSNLQKIQQYRDQLQEIARKIPFVNSAVKFLGVDRFRSEYFFYKIDKGRIYVKFRQSFLCQDKIGQSYLTYESKDQVEKLKAWLNGKGANEKGLLFNINNLQQKQLLDLSNHNIPEILLDNNQMPLFQLQSITREDNLETLIYCENLYKQTILNSQAIAEREKEMQKLFQNLQFFEVNEAKNIKEQMTSQQLSQNHPLRTIFSKYTSKILNWNQKVKRFWHQFIDVYTSSPHQQTQANLHLIVAVWRISMSLYHNQIIKKRQKIQRKKERMLYNLKRQGMGNNLSPGNEDGQEHRNNQQQLTSQLQQNSTPQSEQNQGGIGKRLRKRQYRIKIKDTVIQEFKTPSPYESQQQQKRTQKQKQQNQLLLDYDQTSSKSPEQFCEECFENVNYDSTTKLKVVRCEVCYKVYHKKCLDEDDALRLKTYKNDEWKCDDCQNRVQRQQTNIKLNKKHIIPQAVKVTLRNKSQTIKTIKKKIKQSQQQKLEPKNSKITKKKEKKQRKKREKKNQLQMKKRQTRDKSNRKRIIQGPLSEEEEQPNSEEQQQWREQQIA